MQNRKIQIFLFKLSLIICTFFYLLPINNVWAKDCTDTNINSNIKQLETTDKWIFTIAALRKCGLKAVFALTAELKQQDEQARINAASALGSIGVEEQAAVSSLSAALQDRSERVRSSAASALGNMGVEAQAAVPSLTIALQDRNESVSSNAAYALNRIAEEFRYQAYTLSISELEKIISELEKALKTLEYSHTKFADTEKTLLNQSLQSLKAELAYRKLEGASVSVPEYRWIPLAVTYIVSLASLWLFILCVCPLWLLRINNAMKHHTSIILPGSLGRVEVPVRFLLFVGFFQFHPRVIDAWLNTQITSPKEGFEKKLSQDVKRFVVRHHSFSQPRVGNFVELNPRTVQKYAKAIAWECIKQTYQPVSVAREQVLTAIAALDGYDTAQAYLRYLEKRLGMIQTIGATHDKIRFTHDLLAENLAGLYLVELCCDNELYWRKFLAHVDAVPNKQAIRGFLLAVRDCSLILQTATKIPGFVPEELDRLVGVATKSTGKAQALNIANS